MANTKRHPHKGTLSNRIDRKNIPFIEMSEAERAQAFADIAADSWKQELEKARAGKTDRVQLAVLYLMQPGQEPQAIFWGVENGDGEGLLLVLHLLREIKLIPTALQPGEKLRWGLVEPALFAPVDVTAAQADAIAEDQPQTGVK